MYVLRIIDHGNFLLALVLVRVHFSKKFQIKNEKETWREEPAWNQGKLAQKETIPRQDSRLKDWFFGQDVGKGEQSHVRQENNN